jgi:hypothetical protein
MIRLGLLKLNERKPSWDVAHNKALFFSTAFRISNSAQQQVKKGE